MPSRLSLFTLKRDFDPSILKTVKLDQSFEGGNKVKRECPVADGASIEFSLADFLEIAKQLQFDTRPEFCLVLCEALKDDWLNAVAKHNPPCTVECRSQTQSSLHSRWIYSDHHQTMEMYLFASRCSSRNG